MGTTDRDRHPPDADRKRIGTERAAMEWLDRNALVEAEVTQAAGVAVTKARPIDRRYPRAVADLQLIQ